MGLVSILFHHSAVIAVIVVNVPSGNKRSHLQCDVLAEVHHIFVVGLCKNRARGMRSELSSLGSNLGPAINCHPGVSQAWRGIAVCAAPRTDVKLRFSSASSTW